MYDASLFMLTVIITFVHMFWDILYSSVNSLREHGIARM